MNEPTRILIVDDELPMRRMLRASFGTAGYDLREAETGAECLRITAEWNPDVVLLDLGLPDQDGVQVCREIREWSQVPIIVLSARGQEQDKIKALDAGADDYMTKPFSVPEFQARIRVTLRHAHQRSGPEAPAVYSAGDVTVDLAKHHVLKSGSEIHLTPTEFRLLTELIRHAGMVLTHRHLLEAVWGPAYAEEMHYLRVYMGQLRHKLEEDPTRPKLIRTESGIGYRLIGD